MFIKILPQFLGDRIGSVMRYLFSFLYCYFKTHTRNHVISPLHTSVHIYFFFFKKTIFFYISTFCYQTNKIHKNCSVSSNTHPQSHLPGCLTSVILHALLPSRYTHQGHMLLVLTESHPHPPQPPILFKSVTCWRNQVSCFVDGYTFREPLWHHLVYSCVPHISCNGNWALEPRLDSG